MSLNATALSIPGTLRQELVIDGQSACPLRRSIEASIEVDETIMHRVRHALVGAGRRS